MTVGGGLASLQLYTRAGDRLDGEPLAEQIVAAARQRGLALAYVRRGVAGLGRGGVASDLLVAELRPDRQPVVVQVLGEPAALLALLEHLLKRGLPERRVFLEGAGTAAHPDTRP